MSYRKSITKVIALDWQWVTLRSWCHMNRNSHSSLVKHNVEGKTHKVLETLKIMSGKSTFFGHFFVKYFQVTCVHICVSPNTNYITPILHTHLTLCWSYLRSSDWYLWFCFGFGSCKWKRKEKGRQVGFKGI